MSEIDGEEGIRIQRDGYYERVLGIVRGEESDHQAGSYTV
jgi:hypothetical protein